MRFRMLLILPLLAACDTTGPSHLWTYEGTVLSDHHLVAEVDQYATITCQVDGRQLDVRTGEGATGAHCAKLYSTVERGGMVVPVHTLYIRLAEYGVEYGVRVQ